MERSYYKPVVLKDPFGTQGQDNKRHIQSAQDMEGPAQSQQMADGPLSNTGRIKGPTKRKLRSQINPQFEVKKAGRSRRSS